MISPMVALPGYARYELEWLIERAQRPAMRQAMWMKDTSEVALFASNKQVNHVNQELELTTNWPWLLAVC